MDKRLFLKTSSAVAGGAFLSRFISCAPKEKETMVHLKNWAGNLEYSTGNVHYPKTVAEVQEVVKKCKSLKALGSRHSFNKIADSTENQVSLQELNKVISLDVASNTVTIEAGMRYGELAPYLHEKGYALHNLASLPHITVAGAVATATHGSGMATGNLSTGISAIEFVNAAGDLVSLSKKKDGEQFNGAVVALGALGVVTKLTLDLQPTFNMKQVVYRNLPMKALKNNFNTIMSGGYSVSLFTDWKNKNVSEVWVKSRATHRRNYLVQS
jgi:alditol oxidase